MNPEQKLVDQHYINMAQERFNTATARFAGLYSRGQNMFSVGGDLLARISGRRTPTEQMDMAINELTEARTQLVEVNARFPSQALDNVLEYRTSVANNVGDQWIETGQQIVDATTASNTRAGWLDIAYRANSTIFGALLRAATGGALITASSGSGWIQGVNATTATEVGLFALATGAIDFARHVWLDRTSRNIDNPNLADTDLLIDRQASMQEGLVTGDNFMPTAAIDAELQERLIVETLDQLRVDGIVPLDRGNLKDYSDIEKQRSSIGARLDRYNELRKWVRSRDIAKNWRLIRVLGYTALALGVIAYHQGRPEFCGTRTIGPDQAVGNIFGNGVTDIHSIDGIADDDYHIGVYKRPFIRGADETQLENTLSLLGAKERVRIIIQRVLNKNIENIDMLTDEHFRVKPGRQFNNICPGDLDRAFRP